MNFKPGSWSGPHHHFETTLEVQEWQSFITPELPPRRNDAKPTRQPRRNKPPIGERKRTMKYEKYDDPQTEQIGLFKFTVTEPVLAAVERLNLSGARKFAAAQLNRNAVQFRVYAPEFFTVSAERACGISYKTFRGRSQFRINIANLYHYDKENEMLTDLRYDESEFHYPTLTNVLRIPNIEVRAILFSMLGSDWMGSQIELLTVIDTDKNGSVLYEHADLPYAVLKVVCPSTNKTHFLNVRRGCSTTLEAIASTWGMTSEQYQPTQEA